MPARCSRRIGERPEVRALEAQLREAEAEVRLGKGPGLARTSLPPFATSATRATGSLGGAERHPARLRPRPAAARRGQARADRLRAEVEARKRMLQNQVQAALAVHELRRGGCDELAANADRLADNEALARRSYEVGQIGLGRAAPGAAGGRRRAAAVAGQPAGAGAVARRAGLPGWRIAMKRMVRSPLLLALALACTRREARRRRGPRRRRAARSAVRRRPRTSEARRGEDGRGWCASTRACCATSTSPPRWSRRGRARESAPVPAELRVPDDAYAEVGSPVRRAPCGCPSPPGSRCGVGSSWPSCRASSWAGPAAATREAQARVELARQALEREARPGRRSASRPQREVQEAEAELRSAEAGLASARAALAAHGRRPGQEAEARCCGCARRSRAP